MVISHYENLSFYSILGHDFTLLWCHASSPDTFSNLFIHLRSRIVYNFKCVRFLLGGIGADEGVCCLQYEKGNIIKEENFDLDSLTN